MSAIMIPIAIAISFIPLVMAFIITAFFIPLKVFFKLVTADDNALSVVFIVLVVFNK